MLRVYLTISSPSLLTQILRSPDSILATRQRQHGQYSYCNFFHDDNLRSAAMAALI
jgi:hypothetical protein